MLALADARPCSVQSSAHDAVAGVSVALAPSTHSNISDGVEVGPEYLRVPKHLVSESVQTVQRDLDVRGSYPVLHQITK